MSHLGFLSSILWGMFFGLFFFGGLWLTVAGIRASSSAVVARFIASFLIRFLFVGFGLYWVASGSWFQSVFFLIGLLSMRTIWMIWLGRNLSQGSFGPSMCSPLDSVGQPSNEGTKG